YSNACASPGGDFSGYRVRLTRTPNSINAIIDFNDDGPDGRDTARDLKFDSLSGALSFSFRAGADGDQYSFHGTAGLDKLVGTFDVKLAGARDINRGRPVSMPIMKKVPR